MEIGLPGAANTGDPNGPVEACPLIRSADMEFLEMLILAV